MNDLELLRQYSSQGSQAAFAELVGRYVDLVYSAALRQVRSPDLARDVAQTVFLDLAAAAPRLRPDTHLASWLHVATRRSAIDLIRRRASRDRRDAAAWEVAAMTAAGSSWSAIEPLIDEAIGALGAADREAIIMRFFENRSLAEIGRTLGSGEDAAQKRVSRAVEKLRAALARRGVTTTAAALSADVAAGAVQAAPAGVQAAIAGAVATAAATGALAGRGAPGIFSAAAAKYAAGVLLLAGLGGIVALEWQSVRAARAREAALDRAAATWAKQVASLRDQLARARGAARQGLVPDPKSGDEEFDERIRALLARVSAMRRRFQENPAQRIPEMDLLDDSDWISVALDFPQLETDEQFRMALAGIRSFGKQQFGPILQEALGAFLVKSDGMLPSDPAELAPYLEVPGPRGSSAAQVLAARSAEMLARYEMVKTGPAGEARGNEYVIGEKRSVIPDPEFDDRELVGIGFSAIGDAAEPLEVVRVGTVGINHQQDPVVDAVVVAAGEAAKAYSAANGGRALTRENLDEIKPFFRDPQAADAFLAIMAGVFSEDDDGPSPPALSQANRFYRAANHGESPSNRADLASYFQDLTEGAKYLRQVASETR